jgi:putative SOS response-associated peptidase YedK
MCGRYTLSNPGDIIEELGIEAVEAAAPVPEAAAVQALGQLSLIPIAQAPKPPPLSPLSPRYNIAPTQKAPVVRAKADGSVELFMPRWGLVPYWAKDIAIGNRMINARSETAAEKPSFKSPFRRRRCVVLADGFYEWKSADGAKQPFHIHLDGQRPFVMAGLWDRWTKGDEGVVESFTILTTEANERVRELHDRMPVILDPEACDTWLDPTLDEPAELTALLRPYEADRMGFFPVSKQVNSPRNEVAECIRPIAL